jgi:hypothetical protein
VHSQEYTHKLTLLKEEESFSQYHPDTINKLAFTPFPVDLAPYDDDFGHHLPRLSSNWGDLQSRRYQYENLDRYTILHSVHRQA